MRAPGARTVRARRAQSKQACAVLALLTASEPDLVAHARAWRARETCFLMLFCWFSIFVIDFGLIWTSFLAACLFFPGFRLSFLSVSSKVCFFVGLGERMMPGSVCRRAENIINTMVFLRVRFFTYFVNWVIFNRLLGIFLIAFWEPWAYFFSFLKVWGVGLSLLALFESLWAPVLAFFESLWGF